MGSSSTARIFSVDTSSRLGQTKYGFLAAVNISRIEKDFSAPNGVLNPEYFSR
jgi:hypothetical protein